MNRAGDNVVGLRTAEAQTNLNGPLDWPVARHLDRMNRRDARRAMLAKAAIVAAVAGLLVGGMLWAVIRGMGL